MHGTSMLHVRSGDIYLLAATKQNVDCALVFSLLNQLVLIFRSYFGGKFDEYHIRKNFVLIYELLDGTITPPPHPQPLEEKHHTFILL
jgi:AP-2 complex subunit mu-1